MRLENSLCYVRKGGSPLRILTILLAAVLFIALLVTLAPGCAAQMDPSTTAEVQRVDTLHTATTQAIADTQAELAKLPPDDPVRISLEAKLAQLMRLERQMSATLDTARRVQAEIEAGQIDGPATRDMVKDIPYAPLVLGIGGILWTWMKKTQSETRLKQALRQIVTSVDEVMPSRTDEQKATLNEIQDTDTRLIVDQVKAGTL